MANVASLQAARGQIIDQLSTTTALIQQDRRELARQESNLKFATSPQQRTAIQGNISTLKGQIAVNVKKETDLTNELRDIDQQIAVAQAQQGPRESSGQTVAQAQRANDDRADVISPQEPPPVTATAGVTNADRFSDGAATDAGTNAPVLTTTNSQSLPPRTARPGAVRQTVTPPNSPGQNVTTSARDDQQPVTQPGTASASDDSANSNPIRAGLNRLFSGQITPQANVLDQYASYTYNIAIYLMSARDYRTFLDNPSSTPPSSQLLIQSGGAPVAGQPLPVNQADTITVGGTESLIEDPGQVLANQVKDLQRNQFFSLDYYIDDVRVTSVNTGKGNNQAHNVVRIQFKVIEPNGITFLDNLYKATDQYVRLSGSPQTNYAAQNYLMVIKFYGYDKDGNLVQGQNLTTDVINPQTNSVSQRGVIVEKYIPFQFNTIKFRVANKIVEYDCDCTAVSTTIAASLNRGTIPYNVELTSQSLKDLLGGKEQYAKPPAAGEGRAQAAPAADPRARNPENAGFLGTSQPTSPFQVGA